MRIYSVFEPAAGPARPDDPRSVIFLKEGFCWPALFIPLPWMLYHRMWRAAAGYVGLSVALGLLGQAAGSQEAVAAAIGIGFGLIVAFEANGLRRWHLQKTGYRQVAVVAEKTLERAEMRYFAGRANLPPAPPAPPAPAAPIASAWSSPDGSSAWSSPDGSSAPVARRTPPGWGFMAPDRFRPAPPTRERGE